MMPRAALSVALLATVHSLSDDYDPVNIGFLEAVNVLNPTPAPCSDLSGCDSTDFQYTVTVLNFPGADPLEHVDVSCFSNTLVEVPSNGSATLAGTCEVTTRVEDVEVLRCQPDECGGNVVVNICCPPGLPCLIWIPPEQPSSGYVFVATNPPVPLSSSSGDCVNRPGNTVNCVGNQFFDSFTLHCPAATDAPTAAPTTPPTICGCAFTKCKTSFACVLENNPLTPHTQPCLGVL